MSRASRLPVVILGAGLAGLAAARQLRLSRRPYFLFERESRVGGLCRSEKVAGFTFDYTGHLLHLARPESRALILGELKLKNAFNLIQRRSFIHSHGVYTRYPFQANTYGLPSEVVLECLEGFVNARLEEAKKKPASAKASAGRTIQPSFEDWIVRTFGLGIAKHFMRPYNTKLWGVPPSQMTTDWMGRFIPTPGLRDVLLGALKDRGEAVGYNAQFLYPKQGGIETLVKALAKGADARCGLAATSVDLKRCEVGLSNGQRVRASRIISTLPLPRLLSLCASLPPAVARAKRRLRASSVFNVNFGLKGRNVSDKHWVYVPEERFPFYRVGFCHNFAPANAPKGGSSLYAEISYSRERPLDKAKAPEAVWRGLMDMGILKATDKISARFIADIPDAYVVYDSHRSQALNTIHGFLNENQVISTGRWGAWEYGSMEDAIWQGVQAAKA